MAMTNLEKYDKAFMVNLKVEEEELPGLKYQGIASWDSVGHMDLISDLEEAFGIMMETVDVMDFNTYEHGKEVLAKYDVKIE